MFARPKLAASLLGVTVILAVGGALAGCASPAVEAPSAGALTTASASAGTATADPSVTALTTMAPTRATTDLPSMTVAELPGEAVTTLRLIATGGPYPYRADGTVFSNRERILPQRSHGFYREYTVVTAGSVDRGARRIVTAANGSRFYTDDHYASFTEVVAR